MFPFYAVISKRPWLTFAALFIGFTILFFFVDRSESSTAEHIGKSILMGMMLAGWMKLSFSTKMRRDLSLFGPVLEEGEKIVRSAEAGYIIGKRPIQGNLVLTDRRLIFRHPSEKYWLRPRQVEADWNEITHVQLSVLHSKYRTGVTVKVKGREHIFTVSLADRWVTDIRNVVTHGHPAN
ncbi:hypothetical protein [Dawidia soli]|uniref:GRAM domain-containing protein n=1 Tax=Dawidia soli TaxID=2782352 RepID=A0AAP2GEX3_9BACT|nr:hypothetical protein [Dawidia soli]MBT1688789.1 hypothetical protein [Dawidia soli]